MIVSFLKKCCMAMTHPILFFRFTVHNGLFVKGKADWKRLNRIHLGRNISFGYHSRMNTYGDSKRAGIYIGDNCYFVNRVSLLCGEEIRIENDVLVASDVTIVSENHSVDPLSPLPYKSQPLINDRVYIGEGTWIGEKAVVLPNVSIGKKCVIGAGSIVTKDIEDYCVAVGNPARVIKKYNAYTRRWEAVTTSS